MTRQPAPSEGLRNIDPERLWVAVLQHVGVITGHSHAKAETCGEAVLREYAALARQHAPSDDR